MKGRGMKWGLLPIGLLAAGLAGAAMIADPAAQHPTALGEHRNASWTVHIVRADDALAHRNVSAAEKAWLDAQGEALRSRAWDAMVEVGDAAQRIGEVAGSQHEGAPRARRAYLTALFRARSQGSLEGVLRATERFMILGDLEVVGQCLRIAQEIAEKGGDPQARTRLVAFRERLASRIPEMASHPTGPF